MLKLSTSLHKLFPKFLFAFCAVVNGVVLMSFSGCSLLLCRNMPDFFCVCVCIDFVFCNFMEQHCCCLNVVLGYLKIPLRTQGASDETDLFGTVLCISVQGSCLWS